MKKFILFSFFAITTSSAFSQINKGQWLVGGDAGFTSSESGSGDFKNKFSAITLSPNAGYFLIDKFAAGLRFGYNKHKISNTIIYNNFSIAPFARYYFLPKEQKVNVFADASYIFNRSRLDNFDETTKSSGYSLKAGPAIFLNENVALEFTLGYSRIKENSTDYKTSTFQTGVGFQIHLGGRKGN
jgi:hypothetical protein